MIAPAVIDADVTLEATQFSMSLVHISLTKRASKHDANMNQSFVSWSLFSGF